MILLYLGVINIAKSLTFKQVKDYLIVERGLFDFFAVFKIFFSISLVKSMEFYSKAADFFPIIKNIYIMVTF